MIWPKEMRRVAQNGTVADAVIVGFRGGGEGHVYGIGAGNQERQPIVHWLDDGGTLRKANNGLSSRTHDPKRRGDIVRIVVDTERDLALVLAEPAAPKPPQGTAVEAIVVELVAVEGGTVPRARFGEREELFGPALARDPRRPGDVIDITLDATSGAIIRAPAAPVDDGAERLAEIAREPSRLRRIIDSPWFP